MFEFETTLCLCIVLMYHILDNTHIALGIYMLNGSNILYYIFSNQMYSFVHICSKSLQYFKGKYTYKVYNK